MTNLIIAQFLIYFIGGPLIYFIIQEAVKAPGNSLSSKFVSLGSMTGKSREDIVKVCGPYNHISHIFTGGSVCAWNQTGYMIVIVFDQNGNFVRIAQETSI